MGYSVKSAHDIFILRIFKEYRKIRLRIIKNIDIIKMRIIKKTGLC